MKQFVLSSSEFEDIKSAEKKVQGWLSSGNLNRKVKLYLVTEVYDLWVGFVKRKQPKASLK
jgi:hypothetical protein